MMTTVWYYIFAFLKNNNCTKNEFSIKDFLSKCDQIRSFLRIWSHLQKKSLMENLFFVQWIVNDSKLSFNHHLVPLALMKRTLYNFTSGVTVN